MDLPGTLSKDESHREDEAEESLQCITWSEDSSSIPDNTSVWITTGGKLVEGTVTAQADRPRSYVIETLLGRVEKKSISHSCQTIYH